MFADPATFNFFEEPTLESNLDWIFNNFPDEVFPSIPSSPRMSSNSAIEQVQERAGRTEVPPTHDIDDENGIPNLPIPTPRDRCPPDDPWPMEWHSAPAQHLVLPTLGAVDENSTETRYYPTVPVNDAARANMQYSVRLPLERVPWQVVSLANFPSKAKLDHCIDLYFAHFERFLPIIHRPTFDPGKFPLVTLTITCIGACYTEFDGARAFASALSELNRRQLLFMAEHDPRFVRTDDYVTAQLLQGTHGYGSGSKRLFECSESWRSSLVHNAKCMGLFHYRAPPAPENITLEERWHIWVGQEKFRRLGWAVYEYDSSVSYLHNTRPYISVADVHMDLPSSTADWDANSPQAWAALHPWTESTPKPRRFRATIRTFFDGTPNPLPAVKEDQHRLVIILTLVRMLWTLKEIKGSPICDFVDKPNHTDEDRRNLVAALDMFQESPAALSAPYAGKALASVVRRAQMVHMAHLYAAGDLMDWLYPLLRSRSDAEKAKARMVHWANSSSTRVREVAYHCAQTLSIIRQYPYSLPLEAFNAFHSGVTLWCMAAALPHDTRRGHQGRVIRLDLLRGHSGLDNRPEVSSWIQNGGPQVVSLFGVPSLGSRQGRQQVLEQTAEVLKGMQVWGIAQNFLNVVVELTRADEDGMRTESMV